MLAAGVLSVVLARTIGPSGNGQFALLATLTGIVGLLVSFGLTAGITYEVSRRRWPVRQAFRTSYSAGLALGLVGFLAGLGFFLLTHHSVFHGIRTDVAIVALASLPPVLAYQFADATLLARENYEGYAALELSHSLVLLIAGAGLAIPFGLTGAVIGLPSAALAGATVGAALLVRESARDTLMATSGSLVRAVRFGLQSWGANLLQQVNYRFDIVILGGFATARDVGVYSVALTLTGIAWVLPQALQTVLFPRVASLEESAVTGELSSQESNAALAKAVRHGVLLTMPAALLVGVLLLVAVPLLYGGKFHDTTALGFVLLPGVLMLGIGKILSSAIAGRGYPRYTLYVGGMSVPLTLALYFLLIPPFEAWGAAIASSVSYGLTALLTLWFFRRLTQIGFQEGFVPTKADVTDYRSAAMLARDRLTGRP